MRVDVLAWQVGRSTLVFSVCGLRDLGFFSGVGGQFRLLAGGIGAFLKGRGDRTGRETWHRVFGGVYG